MGEHGNLTPCDVEDTITLKLERGQLLVVPADHEPGEQQPMEVKALDFGDKWYRIFPRELPSVSTANSELPAHLKVILLAYDEAEEERRREVGRGERCRHAPLRLTHEARRCVHLPNAAADGGHQN